MLDNIHKTYLWGLRFDLAGTSERTVDFSHDWKLVSIFFFFFVFALFCCSLKFGGGGMDGGLLG